MLIEDAAVDILIDYCYASLSLKNQIGPGFKNKNEKNETIKYLKKNRRHKINRMKKVKKGYCNCVVKFNKKNSQIKKKQKDGGRETR